MQTETIENDQKHPLDGLKFDSEHRLRSENLAFDIDTWYPKLKDFTFKSVFLPLRREEAESIIAFHDVSWRNYQQRPYLTRKEVSILKSLEESIDKELDMLFPSNANEKAVFLRLCGRSPKDAEPYDRALAVKLYEEELAKLKKEYDEITPNLQMIAISRTKYLKVCSGKDAMSLLLTSERVYAEMIDWLNYGEPEQICLRIWEKELTLDYEFRLFICKGQLTAITQYDHYTYYPYLLPQKEMLQEGLYRYWQTIHPFVNEPDSSYVLDLAYYPESRRFMMVELSPFNPCTGPALFHWQYDREIFEGKYLASTPCQGKGDEGWKDIIFRLKEEKDIHPNVKDLVEINWDMRWREQKPRYDQFYQTTVEDVGEEAKREKSSFFSRMMNWAAPKDQQQQQIQKPQETNSTRLLFVYGTLKRGFQWNTKYLHPRLGATFICPARTINLFALVIGESGVPYLLGDSRSDAPDSFVNGKDLHSIVGEIWEVDALCLRGLDDYEGLSKGYYSRITIPVQKLSSDGQPQQQQMEKVEADVYVLNQSTEDLRSREFIPEYSLELHERLYKPIKHILVKQVHYFGAPSNWGKTSELIDGMIERPES